MSRKKKRNKKKSFQQMLDYLNDQALMIKRVSREVFMDADTGTQKHKKRLDDE